MMKKILFLGLLSSTLLLALAPGVADLTDSIHASLSCEDTPLIGSNDDTIPKTDIAGVLMHLFPYYDTILPGTTNYNGTSKKYGWVSFEVPVKAKVKIITSSISTPEPQRWLGVFDSQCTGRAITTQNVDGPYKTMEMMLEAGTYKLAIHDKDATHEYYDPRYVIQIRYTPVEEQVEIVEGGKTSNHATLLNNEALYTLHLIHATSWKGKAQRYGWYSFDIEKDTHSVIRFTASESGGSWIAIYNENGTRVADKWTAEGTSGLIDVDLPKGHYKIFINKSGDEIDNVRIHINL